MHLMVFYVNYYESPPRYGLCFAPDGSGKPGGKKLFFLEIKERPQEAPFMTLEKKVLREDLQRTAGLGSNYYF
mgnify:FL=1